MARIPHVGNGPQTYFLCFLRLENVRRAPQGLSFPQEL